MHGSCNSQHGKPFEHQVYHICFNITTRTRWNLQPTTSLQLKCSKAAPLAGSVGIHLLPMSQRHGCFYQLGVVLSGVFKTSAPLFGVYISGLPVRKSQWKLITGWLLAGWNIHRNRAHEVPGSFKGRWLIWLQFAASDSLGSNVAG